MFGKSRNQTTEPGAVRPEGAATPSNAPPSIIGPDMRITGDVRCEGDVHVEGTIDGDVQTGTLTVGKSAEVNGEIVADTVRVYGRINGRVRSRDVTLHDSAEVHGDIHHDFLEIARGAAIEGMVKRSSKDDKSSHVNLVVSDGESSPAKT